MCECRKNCADKNDVKTLRDDLATFMSKVDKKGMCLADLKIYAEIIKTISEIKTESFMDYYNAIANVGVCSFKPEPVKLEEGVINNA